MFLQAQPVEMVGEPVFCVTVVRFYRLTFVSGNFARQYETLERK